MKIIALDSSGLVASAAILHDDELVGEYTINHKKTHSQTLLPMLEELKNMTELEMDTVDAIAVAGGPGSFTGLRIGSATAKGLAWTMNIPVISVPTTDAMAYHFYGSDKLICPIMDARRSQVYCGIYTFEQTLDEQLQDDHMRDAQIAEQQAGGTVRYQLRVIQDACAIAVDDLTERLNGLQKEVIFLGDGVPVYACSRSPACICRIIMTVSLPVLLPYALFPLVKAADNPAYAPPLSEIFLPQNTLRQGLQHWPLSACCNVAEQIKMESSFAL